MILEYTPKLTGILGVNLLKKIITKRIGRYYLLKLKGVVLSSFSVSN